ncbi:class I adenylate-forming enzyme family protein [Nocardia amamiensis]|uniref:class I adenylate-forming enzyme family protein n=1 Tax=Nocardia amamiensis TaxID=404578 RepID=UPI000836F87E|nr:AMP-binding protein [Nocardia amamiensis]
MNATLSVAGILAEQARRRPDRTALIDRSQRITFAELWHRARGQAAALIELGVRPGDRVALMCPNVVRFPVAYYAILAAGAVVVPVHPLSASGEAEHLLRDSRARMLLCHPMYAESGMPAAATVGIPCHEPGSLMAEPIASYVSRQPDFGLRVGTVGHSIWGVEVEIADPDEPQRITLLPTGELGEVVIRGHNLFNGYSGNPAATAAAVVDGWFRTGDLGVKDADGYIRIVDRIKEMIIRGGYNVYPSEVDAALLRHPDIAAVAVIGIPDDVYGEEICAVVVPCGPITADQVSDFAREHLAEHKYPRRVEFVTELPLGPSHKILKRKLLEQFE